MRVFHVVALAACLLVAAAALWAQSGPRSSGPDLMATNVYETLRWGTDDLGTIQAYSMGTTVCNVGDVPVHWHDTDNKHPVVSQNMFRLANGRLEHIGQSWAKWSYQTDNESFCATCIDPGTSSELGVQCSDAYTAQFNGTFSQLGPKSVVNPFTGDFPQDHDTPGGADIDGRLQVHMVDLDPAQNPGAVYFLEEQYVASDDASAGNAGNNSAYRQVWVAAGYELTFNDPQGGSSGTVSAPAIQAWQNQDPAVFLNTVNVPGDGRLIVARKATQLSGPHWHYEVAIQNVNSDRAVGGVLVRLPAGATASNLGFHDVDYDAGEPYSGTDWTPTVSAAGPRWDTESYATNVDANALRWATLYNFWFDANVPPPSVTLAELSLFKPGTPTSLEVRIGPVPARTGDMNCDGSTNFGDINPFVLFLSNSSAWQAAYPGCPPENGDINGDGTYGQGSFGDINPFVALLSGG